MDNESNGTEKRFYGPKEAAEMLNVSVDQLRQMRWQGRIRGTRIGNATVYTLQQIQSADTSAWPRGRGSKKKREQDENSPCDTHRKITHQLVA